MNEMTGRIIGNYRIIDKLGEGGMGKVYRAIDTMVEREVALKSLKPEIAAQPDILERFRREAVVLARLNHPAIAQLYTFFKEGSEFYMVMEYVAGETLERAIQNRGALPWAEAVACAVQILEGIGHAHSLGILHRDLKPANVILTPAGKVKIMDFGIAQALGAARLTREGRIVGTLEYLAPERVQGKPSDVRSDLYSTGVVLYEMLTGRLPFESDSEYELLLAQVQKQAPEPRELGIDLPPALESVVMRALEKNPDDRHPDAASFAAALLAAGPDGGVVHVPERIAVMKPTRLVAEAEIPARVEPARAAPARSKRRLAPAGAAVALVLVAAGASLWLWRPNHKAAAPAAQATMEATAATGFPAEPPPQTPMPAPAPAPATIPFNLADLDSRPKARPAVPKESAPVRTETTLPAAPAAPAAEKRAPVLTAELRRSAVAALEQGDGPIRLSGLLAALRIGGGAVTADVAGPIASRGVDFSMAPADEAALRQAGATPELLRLIASSYTAPHPAPPAPPVNTPEKRPRSLMDLRSIFVDKAEGGLDRYMKDEIRKQLGGLVRLVDSAASADGIMRVTVAAQKGGAVSGAARVLGIRDRSVVRAAIVEPGSARIIWQQGTGDRKPIIGAFRGDSLQSMSERIVRELKEDLVNRQSHQ